MKLAFEKEMLGIYVSDHPLREIAERDRERRARSRSATPTTFADGTIGLVRRHPHEGGRRS